MFKKSVLFLLCALAFAGCGINEDLSACLTAGEQRMGFIYTANVSGQDQLVANAKDIRVYVFDQTTGVLAAVLDLTAEDIARGNLNTGLPNGTYTMVAWAASGTNILQGGFSAAQAIGGGAYLMSATVGQTTLSDFRMLVNTLPVSDSGPGAVVPQTKEFDNLFHAVQRDVRVASGQNMNLLFSFTKSSSVVDVSITGLKNLTYTGTPQIFAVGKNGVLLADNSTDTAAPSIRYEAISTSGDGFNSQAATLKILRIDMAKEAADPTMIYVRDSTGRDIIPPINLLAAIQSIKNEDGSQKYQTQADIDRADKIQLFVNVAQDYNLGITIKVGGFEPTPLQPE